MNQNEVAREWWSRFQSAFVTTLDGLNPDGLCTLWHEFKDGSGKIGQTRLYDQRLLPTVGASLGLSVQAEKSGRVDWVLSTKQDEVPVPVIFVESETVTKLIAEDELPKLCSCSAPLKVLFTCEEWDQDPRAWPPKGGFRSQYLPIWERVIAASAKHWPQPGVLAIMIGEWRGDEPRSPQSFIAGRLSFWGRAYSGDGRLVDGSVESDRLLWRKHFRRIDECYVTE
jgi:hypothetical protein